MTRSDFDFDVISGPAEPQREAARSGDAPPPQPSPVSTVEEVRGGAPAKPA